MDKTSSSNSPQPKEIAPLASGRSPGRSESAKTTGSTKFSLTSRTRMGESKQNRENCLRKRIIAENAGCFLGHRNICFHFPEGKKSEWNGTRLAGMLTHAGLQTFITPKGVPIRSFHRSIEVTYEGERIPPVAHISRKHVVQPGNGSKTFGTSVSMNIPWAWSVSVAPGKHVNGQISQLWLAGTHEVRLHSIT